MACASRSRRTKPLVQARIHNQCHHAMFCSNPCRLRIPRRRATAPNKHIGNATMRVPTARNPLPVPRRDASKLANQATKNPTPRKIGRGQSFFSCKESVLISVLIVVGGPQRLSGGMRVVVCFSLSNSGLSVKRSPVRPSGRE